MCLNLICRISKDNSNMNIIKLGFYYYYQPEETISMKAAKFKNIITIIIIIIHRMIQAAI